VSSNPENRKHARFEHQSIIRHEDLDEGIYASSRMFNFSKDGLYFESNAVLEAGEKIFIGIENSPYVDNPGTYECYHAEICWRQELEYSRFKYGYGVRYCLTDTDWDPESRPAACPMPEKKTVRQYTEDEKRRFPRIPMSKNIAYFTPRGAFSGLMKNICRNGAYIETPHVMQIGKIMTIALPFINKGKGAMVKAEVIWHDKNGFGIKFKKAKKTD
jgi:Tfp pilus assembly protein PilZ